MRGSRRWLPLLLALLLIFVPTASNAGIGLSFDLISFGPFSLGLDIPLGPAVLLLGGALLLGSIFTSFFSGDSLSGSGSYIASYPGPGQITTHVSIKPGEVIPARALRVRMRHSSLFTTGTLQLPRQRGSLKLENNGKLLFKGTTFKGYAYVHYDNSMSVWDEFDKPVLLIHVQEGKTLIVQERSERAQHVIALLFGLPQLGGAS